MNATYTTAAEHTELLKTRLASNQALKAELVKNHEIELRAIDNSIAALRNEPVVDAEMIKQFEEQKASLGIAFEARQRDLDLLIANDSGEILKLKTWMIFNEPVKTHVKKSLRSTGDCAIQGVKIGLVFGGVVGLLKIGFAFGSKLSDGVKNAPAVGDVAV